MRTNDGKLAILDFGLMTEVTDNQKYGMIEGELLCVASCGQVAGRRIVN